MNEYIQVTKIFLFIFGFHAYIWPRITNKIPNPFAASMYSNLVLSFIIHHPNFRFLQSLLAILYFHIFIGKNLRINIDSFYNIKHFFSRLVFFFVTIYSGNKQSCHGYIESSFIPSCKYLLQNLNIQD